MVPRRQSIARMQMSTPMADLVDLHAHTHFSDGVLSPTELVREAKESGLAGLAVTDHDTLGGVQEAQAAGRQYGLTIVPGVELSVSTGEEEVHVLGYFVSPDDGQLAAVLEEMRAGRRRRARQIVERLEELNVPVSWESIQAGAERESVGRPHIAAALVEAGHVDAIQEAFEKYIGNDGPAYVRKPLLTSDEAVAALHEAGGIAVLAHPGQWTSTDQIRHLVRVGLDGIEIRHPSHRAWLVTYYERLAREMNLIGTGGSDYHGHRRSDQRKLGRYGVPKEQVEEMRRLVRNQNAS